jgi:hypothetical protein
VSSRDKRREKGAKGITFFWNIRSYNMIISASWRDVEAVHDHPSRTNGLGDTCRAIYWASYPQERVKMKLCGCNVAKILALLLQND